MSYEFFFQIVHLYRYVTKGNINGIFEKIDVFQWRDVIYFTYADFQFTEKEPCIDFT